MDALKAADSASGHYDVTMLSGAHITGTFVTRYCAALASFATGLPRCTPGAGTSTSCSNSCACKGNTVSATCAHNDAGTGYDCTCTSATGAQSICSKTSSVPLSFACTQGETCCPLAF